MDGESLGTMTDRKINHTDKLEGFVMGVSLHPLLFHRSKFPHQSTNGATNQIIFAPQGRSWALWEQRQEASHSYSSKSSRNVKSRAFFVVGLRISL